MLDENLKLQLQEVFKNLDDDVGLIYDATEHEKGEELIGMLEGIAQTSPFIKVAASGERFHRPRFSLYLRGVPTGIVFDGIPGGHEFSSVVLAILNSVGQGKLPDIGITDRIAKIKGPLEVKTYISLACDNCPDVVQALNIMALHHPSMQHTMVDGGLAQDEVENLHIQGVPSVIVGDELVSSGKTTLIELIKRFEAKFGKNIELGDQQEPAVKELGHYDVVIVGGGPAGASSAIYSARKGLKTLIIAERMGGQVQDTKGIENMISMIYTEGPQLTDQLNKHIAQYDIEVAEHRLVSRVEQSSYGEKKIKKILLDSGEVVSTDSLIVATGAKWRKLGVPGEKEYIGSGVAFCPHCDGPYYKGKDIAVVGGGNSGVEAAIDLAGIVKSVTLIEFAADLKADGVLIKKLQQLPNVHIVTNAKTTQILGNGRKVTGIEWQDCVTGELNKIDLDGVFVQIGLVPNSEFISHLVEINAYGEIIIDEKGRTNIAGIYAAGDVTNVPYKQIIVSMGEGAKAALASFEDRMAS